jgi:hypothetical protein
MVEAPLAEAAVVLALAIVPLDIFEALIEMINLDLIDFPESYDGKGVLIFHDEKGNPIPHELSFEEQLALVQIDLAKEEMVNIYRFESPNGNCRYNLPPDKETKMHDDRVFTIALLAWFLQQLRRDNILNPQLPEINLEDYFFYV